MSAANEVAVRRRVKEVVSAGRSGDEIERRVRDLLTELEVPAAA